MERIGVLVVSYGAREAAMIDVLGRSTNHRVFLYIADKQSNPFNIERATKHVVIPDLDIKQICKFAEANKDQIDFVLVGPEKPIIEGIRDLIEESTGIPVICPKKDYAIEISKVQQRLLFQEITPEANPRFKIFNPKNYAGRMDVKEDVYCWLDKLENQAVVKPDKPAAGKGVGVWGDHFNSREELFDHFISNFQYGAVIIEEKIEGEESSFQILSDGKHFMPLPDTRDYKRAFDGDKGPNTGGMGSYKDAGDMLPFLTMAERERELSIAKEIFEKWQRKTGDSSALRGVPLYLAFMHTGAGLKILENNSRPGDPEIINILPILEDDFVDICFKILEGNLHRIDLEKHATVLTYKVPPNYGGYRNIFPHLVNEKAIGTPVDLSKLNALKQKFGDNVRVYPGAMQVINKAFYAMNSRVVGVLGIGEDIEEARKISLEGTEAVTGGALWNRKDVASKEHIAQSIHHMEKLRRRI